MTIQFDLSYRIVRLKRDRTMIKTYYNLIVTEKLVILLPVFLLWIAPVYSEALNRKIPENKYFETRDHYIEHFKKSDVKYEVNNLEDHHALSELEKILEEIIGPISAKGFSTKGKISWATLMDNYYEGPLPIDGLRFNSTSEETLVVTTKDLLKNYLTLNEYPIKFSELAKTGEFFARVIDNDAAVTYFSEVPVKSASSQFYASVFLGLAAQDIGDFTPENLYVFVSNGNQILLVVAPTTIKINQIAQCKKIWDASAKKSENALEIYRASNLTNEKAFNDHTRYEEEGFESYKKCWGREVKNQQFFAPLTSQAQSIVDRLQ